LNFDTGCSVVLDGEVQITKGFAGDPTLLISKRTAKKIAVGQTVRLQVVKADGSLSDPVSFTRSPSIN
jgi:hypothetical protein